MKLDDLKKVTDLSNQLEMFRDEIKTLEITTAAGRSVMIFADESKDIEKAIDTFIGFLILYKGQELEKLGVEL